MRFFLLLLAFCSAFQCFSQEPGNLLISGVVVSQDSVPVPDVAIINLRTGNSVRTNANGFFLTEMAMEDSLLVYHIAYKNQFINSKYKNMYILMEPEIQEIMQVDVTDKKEQEQKNLEQTLDDIRRLALMEKLSGYELISMQEYFINENGSHTKGFSPFFGPTISIPLVKLETEFSTLSESVQQRNLTLHYHLVNKKK